MSDKLKILFLHNDVFNRKDLSDTEMDEFTAKVEFLITTYNLIVVPKINKPIKYPINPLSTRVPFMISVNDPSKYEGSDYIETWLTTRLGLYSDEGAHAFGRYMIIDLEENGEHYNEFDRKRLFLV